MFFDLKRGPTLSVPNIMECDAQQLCKGSSLGLTFAYRPQSRESNYSIVEVQAVNQDMRLGDNILYQMNLPSNQYELSIRKANINKTGQSAALYFSLPHQYFFFREKRTSSPCPLTKYVMSSPRLREDKLNRGIPEA